VCCVSRTGRYRSGFGGLTRGAAHLERMLLGTATETVQLRPVSLGVYEADGLKDVSSWAMLVLRF
jgi:hypothetical protein